MIRTEDLSFPGPDIRGKDILSLVTGSHGAYFEHEMTDQGHISILMLPTLLDIFQDRMNVGAAEHVNHTIENGLLEFELQEESASTDALSLDRGGCVLHAPVCPVRRRSLRRIEPAARMLSDAGENVD